MLTPRIFEQHNFEFIVFLAILLLLGIVQRYDGLRLATFVRSFVNPSLVTQQVRQERSFNRVTAPIFVVVISVIALFIALYIERKTIFWSGSLSELFFLLSAVLILLTAVRIALYSFFSWLVDLRSVFKEHSVHWLLHNFILISILLPTSVLVVFGPAEFQNILLTIGLVAVGGLYLIRSFRLFSMVQSVTSGTLMYNIFYLCALEFLPLGVALAWIFRQ